MCELKLEFKIKIKTTVFFIIVTIYLLKSIYLIVYC
jgi:hypothetical protein